MQGGKRKSTSKKKKGGRGSNNSHSEAKRKLSIRRGKKSLSREKKSWVEKTLWKGWWRGPKSLDLQKGKGVSRKKGENAHP